MGQSSITGQETIVFSDNASYDGTERGGAMVSDGQLWMGSSTVAPGLPRVRLGTIVAGAGITVTYSETSATTNRLTIAMAGGSTGVDSFAMQTGTNPVNPDGFGLVTFNGAAVAAGTNPVRTNGTAATTMQVEVQIAQAIAAEDTTKVGLANFDSGDFTVSNGFVVLAGGGAGQTITGDSGGALSPTTGNWNILGGPGVTTSGSGSTLTINSVLYTDQAAPTAVAADSGSMSTAAITLTLPAAPANGTRCEFIASTADALIVDAPGTAIIRIGNVASSAGGTATSTAQSDSLSLVYQSSTDDWHALSVVGVFVLA